MSLLRRTSWRHRVAERFSQWFDRFYFEPAGPLGLVVCRAWIYAFLALDLWRRDNAEWAGVTPTLWHPIGLFAWLPAALFSPEIMLPTQIVFTAVLVGCSLGLGFRALSWAALIMGLIMFGLPNCYGKVDHSQTLTIFALGIFAVSRAGEVGSLDAWLTRRRGLPAPPAVSSEYQWPVRLMQVLMSVIFMAAGIAKLRSQGLDWVLSDHFQNTLVRVFYTGSAPPTNLGLWLAQFPWLCKLLAGMTILVELTAPLALVSRRYRWFVIPSLFSMQLGIYVVMGITFWQYLACYAFWVDWNTVGAAVSNRLAGRRGSVPTAEPPLATHRPPARAA